MRILFSLHAMLKIGQRKISKRLVTATILSPDFILPGRNGREERYKRFRTQNLKVVVVYEEKVLVIVTAHWVARLKNKL